MKDPEALIRLRQRIHRHPELSGQEQDTAAFVAGYLQKCNARQVLTALGGYSVAGVFGKEKQGPRILLRAELDALPIPETGTLSYRSENAGIAHLCGHDGHIAILLGVARHLQQHPPEKGEVVLLFQAAEETGEGAQRLLEDPGFSRIRPDAAFALHNLPSFPENQVLLRQETFACASKGLIIRLSGKTSHAAHPESGNSPDKAVARIIDLISNLSEEETFEDFVLCTIIHARIGEVAFGTTPGEASVMITLRAALENDMQSLTRMLESKVKQIASTHSLAFDISYTEVFPATINHPVLTDWVAEVAQKMNRELSWMPKPFRWSEDFGHFTASFPSVLFGIGSGENHPALHNPDYDFNDALITPSVALFTQILDFSFDKLKQQRL
jgi:amidohydrolase